MMSFIRWKKSLGKTIPDYPDQVSGYYKRIRPSGEKWLIRLEGASDQGTI